MYTIKQAASRSGVSVPLLRAWERRYHIVEPARTPAGYRLYDDAAIDRIRTMRRLVDAGWTPSTAAGAIQSGETIPPLDRDAGAGRSSVATLSTGGTATIVDDFVEATIALDADRLEAVLDRMFATGSFESVADDILLPAVAAIGDAWAAGRLDIAAEHAASHAALRRLAAAFQAAGHPAPPTGAILVGLPPGARHELGALAFATAARRDGLPVLYLGPDLPVDDWVATAGRARPRAAVIGVVTANDVRPATAVIRALQAAAPGLTVAVGGRSASRAAEAVEHATAADDRNRDDGAAPSARPGARSPVVLPEPLREGVTVLRQALDGRHHATSRGAGG